MEEIKRLPDGSVLDVNSGGGEGLTVQELVHQLHGRGFNAIIRDVRSTSALIALGCCTRRIVPEGLIVLCLGDIRFIGTMHLDNSVCRRAAHFAELVKWQIRWLEERFPLLIDTLEMCELKLENRTEIRPARALELGLVHEICEASPFHIE
jgi:hypothetical protein